MHVYPSFESFLSQSCGLVIERQAPAAIAAPLRPAGGPDELPVFARSPSASSSTPSPPGRFGVEPVLEPTMDFFDCVRQPPHY